MSVGGTVRNFSRSNILCAYNDETKPGRPFRYTLLAPSTNSPGWVDVDGFKSADGKGIRFDPGTLTPDFSAWTQWWKIRDLVTAEINEDAKGLYFKLTLLSPALVEKKTDTDFQWTPSSPNEPFPPYPSGGS